MNQCRTSTSARTLVVGLDAACWEYLDPLCQSGRLPHLSRLMERGAYGRLRSTMPPITPAAWSSLISGVNPGKHGVFDWVERQEDSYRFTPSSANSRMGTPVWEWLNRSGVRTGVVNLPLTYPPRPLDGFLLCGFSAPPSARDLTYPADVLAQVENEFGTYYPAVRVNADKSAPEVFYQASRGHQERLVSIAISLWHSYDVQVLVINLMLIDHSNHRMPTMELVEQAMIDTDADLGRLLSELDPDNIIVLSDHGSRRVKGVFLLNAWLADRGLLTRKRRPASERARVANYVLEQWMNGKSRPWQAAQRRLLREALARLPGRLTAPLRSAIEHEIPLASMQIDTGDEFVPHRTRAYPSGGNHGYVSLNLQGREPEGTVARQDAETLLAGLTEALFTVRTPDTGEALFASIYRPDDIYIGPLKDSAPDLITDYYQSNWSVISALPGLSPRPWRYFVTGDRWYGDHRKEGIYVVAGSDFGSTAGHDAELLDIPATILYLYGVPQPYDYDGKPLLAALQACGRPLTYQPGDERSGGGGVHAYSVDEEKEILERLSQLGYVDG
ncbi:MAG: alkaline phosphatase family protein [Anaerolineae bacterium]|nr:alkaline phosphatase family protein [Anaerolineae bacterium]